MGLNSILIVEFARQLRRQGLPFAGPLKPGRHLRPLTMTTFATLLGLIPLALALEAGSEQYAVLPESWLTLRGISSKLQSGALPRFAEYLWTSVSS
jgi:AcrB/AcrD/AcrF family